MTEHVPDALTSIEIETRLVEIVAALAAHLGPRRASEVLLAVGASFAQIDRTRADRDACRAQWAAERAARAARQDADAIAADNLDQQDHEESRHDA